MNYLIDLINKKSESSSIRFCLVFSFLFVTLTPFIVWGVVCIHNNKLEDLPAGIVTFGLGVLGIITTGKVFEKKEENKNGVS
ncbi:MAG: hypothetical protein WC451_05475 [Patescibacteria group bacterium]